MDTNTFFVFRNHSELQDDSTEERTDIVELLEAIAYLICIDEPVRPDTFHKILSSRGIPAKILRLADTDRDGEVSVEEMMSFIMVITNPITLIAFRLISALACSSAEARFIDSASSPEISPFLMNVISSSGKESVAANVLWNWWPC